MCHVCPVPFRDLPEIVVCRITPIWVKDPTPFLSQSRWLKYHSGQYVGEFESVQESLVCDYRNQVTPYVTTTKPLFVAGDNCLKLPDFVAIGGEVVVSLDTFTWESGTDADARHWNIETIRWTTEGGNNCSGRGIWGRGKAASVPDVVLETQSTDLHSDLLLRSRFCSTGSCAWRSDACAASPPHRSLG